MVCFVVGANPPLHVMDGFVKRIWKDLNIDKIGMVNKGVFWVRFNSKEFEDKACGVTDILYDKKPFVIKPWNATSNAYIGLTTEIECEILGCNYTKD